MEGTLKIIDFGAVTWLGNLDFLVNYLLNRNEKRSC